MLLRDETQTAMNQVETLCFEAADHYESAAGRSGDPELARLFNEEAQQHRMLAAELAAHIRAMDDLPQQPDPDMEAVEDVLRGIKTFLSGDPRRTLIDECREIESRLIQAANAALAHELRPETQTSLRRIVAHGEEAIGRLAKMQEDPQSSS